MYGNAQNVTHAAPPQNQPPQPQRYVVRHDFDGTAELTTTLVHAISDVAGVDVTAAEFTLNDYIDADALDRLFEPKPDGTLRNGTLNISIWNCHVTIFADGQIEIIPPAPQRRM